MTEVAGGGGFVFSDLKWTTGFLSEVHHELYEQKNHFVGFFNSWFLMTLLFRIFAIYTNQVNAYIILPSKCPNTKYDLKKPGKLCLYAKNQLKGTKELRWNCDDMSAAPHPHNLYATVWVNADNSWDDSIDLMRIVVEVEREECKMFMAYF